MPRKPSTFRERVKLFVALTAAAAFLLLMPSRFTSPLRVVFNETTGPVQTGAFQAGGELLAASGSLTEMLRRTDRERALTREVVRLRNANAELADEARRYAQRLDSVSGLQVRSLRVRALRVPLSSYDATAMSQSITVRAGSSDGVARGMAVAAYGALVGIVTEAGPWQSRVRLITDAGSVVPCRMSRTRDLCVLQGTGGEECRLDWLKAESFVEPGDVCVTASLDVNAGTGLSLPDGLPVATVLDVQDDQMRPLFLAVRARPRVNLSRLEEVDILIPEP